MSSDRSARKVGFLLGIFLVAFTVAVGAEPITNLQQLTAALSSGQPTKRDLKIEATVCATSRPKIGVLIVQDATGVELLHLGEVQKEFIAGERIHIHSTGCLLRKREMGIEISAMPVVRNDGLHSWSTVAGEAFLTAGKTPVQLEWFNYWKNFSLEVTCAFPDEGPRFIAATNLWHREVTPAGTTNLLPGLRAEIFEGVWESMPYFNLLQPAKTGLATNFNLDLRSRDERVGIRFTGYLEVPRTGRYRFEVSSDDGSLLFLGNPNVPLASIGQTAPPTPKPSNLLAAGITNLDERCWATVEGRASFISVAGESIKLELGADRQTISVIIADASGLHPHTLLNARIRIQGIGRGVMLDRTLVMGKLFAASAKDITFLEPALGQGELKLPITSIAQVQSLPIELASQGLPVRLRGTVTGAVNTSQEHWMSFQDDTRGIFVRLNTVSNTAPVLGEQWELAGHSEAGDFAPIIIADTLTRLGEGLLPAPVHPTWTELLNGSRDVQWAELKGLVTDIHSNTVSLYLPEGRLDVELDGSFASDLQQFLKANVKIRGVLYAVWDAVTREVRVGRVMMRHATVSVDVPAPANPFDAVQRTPRELLLFDAQASAFRPVKVRGQITYADPTELFLEENGTGLRLLPVEKTDVRPGDLVEAVGYPDIGRTQLLLREVLIKKTGHSPLPAPDNADVSTPSRKTLNSTRVRVQGRLLGWHIEQGSPVLEMQSGTRLYLARIAPEESSTIAPRPGSRLALNGVYVSRSQSQKSGSDNESFELLLNSAADITVISQPSWWTLPRLFALVSVLLVILIFTFIWNTQLRRQVEQRTHQLQHEIQERERVERKHALEAERSRIARDLHDDLGSSLTEISVLASSGQLRQASVEHQPGLFQAIGTKARSLISALDVIVWAVDPEDNSLQSLADYLSGYAGEFFSHTDIACRFKVPVSFPAMTLEGRVRHELLMAVKESLNNIVRHAAATEVEFSMAMAEKNLEIFITDNGKGIAGETPGDGHGLKNLSARLQKLGGDCAVEPRPGGGTIVKLRLPLTAFENAR